MSCDEADLKVNSEEFFNKIHEAEENVRKNMAAVKEVYAKKLKRRGFTLTEISKTLKISWTDALKYTRGVELEEAVIKQRAAGIRRR